MGENMDGLEFDGVLEQLQRLSRRQLVQLREALNRFSRADEVIELIEARTEGHPKCAHCDTTRVYRHGIVDGLQRYRCLSCRRTFNALTGTPLAHLRLKGTWLAYLQSVLHSTTVRDAAAEVGIHKNTSFRWRHRFLSWAKNDRPVRLHGIAEADEAYLLESQKGARNLDRPARKRGEASKFRGTSSEQVCVLIARDRTGQTLDFITGRGPVSKRQLAHVLPPVLDDDILLVTDSNASYKYFALENHVSHEAINLKAGTRVRGAIHVQNVNAYHSRLRGWLHRFHGVATHYLINYLGWRRGLDSKRFDCPETLLKASLGEFPHLAGT